MSLGDLVLRKMNDTLGTVVYENPLILRLQSFHCYVYIRPDEEYHVLEQASANQECTVPFHVLQKIRLLQESLSSTGPTGGD